MSAAAPVAVTQAAAATDLSIDYSREVQELNELQDELHTLKEDNTYVDFVEAVVTGKDIVLESESEDPNYTQEETEKTKENGDQEESGFQDNECSSSSDSDFDDALEDFEEESADKDDKDDPIPARMSLEASSRFPFGWRTNMKLKAAEAIGEEGDADYCPPSEADMDAARDKKEQSEEDSSEESESEDDEEEMAVEATVPIDDSGDMARALEEMQLATEEVEREKKEQGEEANLLHAISSFDDSTYDEAADSDFSPPADVDEVIEAAEEEDERILQGEEEEEITDEEQEEGSQMET